MYSLRVCGGQRTCLSSVYPLDSGGVGPLVEVLELSAAPLRAVRALDHEPALQPSSLRPCSAAVSLVSGRVLDASG